jgi:hypothetical protein
MPRTHRLDADVVHYEWNNAIAPRLEIGPGDTVVFDARGAADGFYKPTCTSGDGAARGPSAGSP